MNYLLINVTKGLTPLLTSGCFPPIGLLYIASSLEAEGHKVEVLDFYCENNPVEEIKRKIKSFDAIGLNVYSKSIPQINHIISIIKKINPDIPIIIGGPHCTFHPEDALIDIPADISVEGEAEQSIKDVAKALTNNSDLSKIPGIYYRKNNKIKKGRPFKLIKDLDAIKFPSRNLIEKYVYCYGKINKEFFYPPKFTCMMTSRGCPYRCSFCTRHIVTSTYRKRSAENVIEELRLIDEKYDTVGMLDDNFLQDKKRIFKIMDKIIESKIDLNIYIMGARVDSANIDLYKKIKKAGVKYIGFGIESGNQEIIDFYNKKITLKQVVKAVNLARKMDFLVTGSFILGAPFETINHVKKTMKFACSLPLDYAVFSPLSYDYGSDIWKDAVKTGKINEDTDKYAVRADSLRGLGNFTTEELTELCKKGMSRFYSRPSYITRKLFTSLLNKDFNAIISGTDFFYSLYKRQPS